MIKIVGSFIHIILCCRKIWNKCNARVIKDGKQFVFVNTTLQVNIVANQLLATQLLCAAKIVRSEGDIPQNFDFLRFQWCVQATRNKNVFSC